MHAIKAVTQYCTARAFVPPGGLAVGLLQPMYSQLCRKGERIRDIEIASSYRLVLGNVAIDLKCYCDADLMQLGWVNLTVFELAY